MTALQLVQNVERSSFNRLCSVSIQFYSKRGNSSTFTSNVGREFKLNRVSVSHLITSETKFQIIRCIGAEEIRWNISR